MSCVDSRPEASQARPNGEGARDLASLVVRIARRDEAALGALYDATSPWIYGLVLRIVRDRQIADEVSLDVYMQAWNGARTYSADRGTVRAWLVTMARSRALDRLRRSSVRREVTVSDLPDPAAPADDRPESDLEATELRANVSGALSALPAPQRECIELAFYEGLTHSEIARRRGQPLGTVKTQIRRGIGKLRQTLSPDVFERGSARETTRSE